MLVERQKIIKELEDVVLDITLFLRHEIGNEVDCELGKSVMNLSYNQQMILFLIEKKDIKHVKDLASYLSISPSAVSQIIAKFEQQDIVIREIQLSNRRTTLIKIGPKGRDILNEMDAIKSNVFVKYLSKMEEEDLLSFKKSFHKFLNIIVEHKEEHE